MSASRVFCWLPTPVWTDCYWRDGFVWLGYAWRVKNNDGSVQFYRNKP